MFLTVLLICIGVIVGIVIICVIFYIVSNRINEAKRLIYTSIIPPTKKESFTLKDPKKILSRNPNFINTFNKFIELYIVFSDSEFKADAFRRRADGYGMLFCFNKQSDCISQANFYKNKSKQDYEKLKTVLLDLPEFDNDIDFTSFLKDRDKFCTDIGALPYSIPSFNGKKIYHKKIEGSDVIFLETFCLIIDNYIYTLRYADIEISFSNETDTYQSPHGEYSYTHWRYACKDGSRDLRYNNNYSTTYYTHTYINFSYGNYCQEKLCLGDSYDSKIRKDDYLQFFNAGLKNNIKCKNFKPGDDLEIDSKGNLVSYYGNSSKVSILKDFTTIQEDAFKDCDNVATIEINNKKLKTIKSHSFNNLKYLRNISIDSPNVVNFEADAFYGVSKNIFRFKINKCTFGHTIFSFIEKGNSLEIKEYHGNLEMFSVSVGKWEKLSIEKLFAGTEFGASQFNEVSIGEIHNIEKIRYGDFKNSAPKCTLISDKSKGGILTLESCYEFFTEDSKPHELKVVNYNKIDEKFGDFLTYASALDLGECNLEHFPNFRCFSSNIKKIVLPSGIKKFDNYCFQHFTKLSNIIGYKPHKLNKNNDSVIFSSEYVYGERCIVYSEINKVIVDKKTLTENELDIMENIGTNIFVTQDLSDKNIHKILNIGMASTIKFLSEKYDSNCFCDITEISSSIKELTLPRNPIMILDPIVFDESLINTLEFTSELVILSDNIFAKAKHLKFVSFNNPPINYETLKKKYKKIIFTCSNQTKKGNLSKIVVKDSNWLGKNKLSSIGSLVIDKEKISDGEFAGLINLKEVIFKQSINEIPTDAFLNCYALEKVVFEQDLPKIFKANCFKNCINLEEIGFIKDATFIGPHAFESCTKIKEINLPYTISKVEEASFSKCISVDKLFIPGSVTDIDNNAFSYCMNISSISGMDKIINVGETSFGHCSSLKKVVFPKTLKTYKDSLSNCNKLTSIVFSNDMELLKINSIPESLKEIILPHEINKFEFPDLYSKAIIYARRGSSWRKQVKHIGVEYYSPDQFIDVINQRLLENGYSVIQTDKKIKIKVDKTDVNDYLSEIYDLAPTEPVETYDDKLRKTGAYWDTEVFKDADLKEKEPKIKEKGYTFEPCDKVFDNLDLSLSNKNICIKNDKIFNQIFNADIQVNNLVTDVIFITTVNLEKEIISNTLKVVLTSKSANLSVPIELQQSAENGNAYIVVFDKKGNEISCGKIILDRQILSDDDFGIFI